MWGTPYSYQDSFICVPWLIHMCDMTHSYEWHDSFICVTRLIHMCAMTHSYVWHDTFMNELTCDMNKEICNSSWVTMTYDIWMTHEWRVMWIRWYVIHREAHLIRITRYWLIHTLGTPCVPHDELHITLFTSHVIHDSSICHMSLCLTMNYISPYSHHTLFMSHP